ncbi:glycosyltransferase family 4 protein [Chenggangzhangella methanolivorans]|uniref:Glycosyltransferase family 4 protein n=1 Tax=Chenggangzhangella methanolivorans TaxID=1437009 RepID=A0A9E6RB15_9HYPH|nr:glycosyltransferase family 4 protein [Chenggangzhangella methanolivorans]QZO01466.1 glycosyltransferase family 4 protein [Chenggangzhangella methanolivorans]
MPFAYRLAGLDDEQPQAPDRRATLVICNLGEKLAAQRALKIASELGTTSGRDVVLLSETRAQKGDGLLSTIEAATLDRLAAYDVLIAIDRNERASLSGRMISVICSLKVVNIRRINPRGKTRQYVRPPREGAKRALFVFPGVFAPPRIGSHQRAFSTCLDLIEAGFDVDVVVKRQGLKRIDRVRHYSCSSPIGSRPTRRGARRRLRRQATRRPPRRRSSRSPPRLFVRAAQGQRRSTIAPSRCSPRWRRRPATTWWWCRFPWMLSAVEDVDLNGAKLVCDTMTSSRTASASSPTPPRRRPRPKAALERDLLARCAAVLAISRSDAKMFRAKLGLDNVVVHPLSYYPTETIAQWRSMGRPLVFGFIGSDMEPNRRALQHVMSNWWPAIEAFSPESRIVIGGAIALSPSLSPYVLLRENVTVAGPVEEVGQFFDQIDVLLSPTVVQGGVNVKNVEALLRRRPVIVNTLGARDAALVAPTRCETTDGLVALLKKIDRGDPAMLAAIDQLFEEAAAYHGKPGLLEWA